MDRRTADLLDALAHPGAAILLELLDRDATQAELLQAIENTTQATVQRRLERLEQIGVAQRTAGRWRAPNRVWSLAHQSEVETLVRAALDLADALANAEAAQRRAALHKVRSARAARVGLRPVDDKRP